MIMEFIIQYLMQMKLGKLEYNGDLDGWHNTEDEFEDNDLFPSNEAAPPQEIGVEKKEKRKRKKKKNLLPLLSKEKPKLNKKHLTRSYHKCCLFKDSSTVQVQKSVEKRMPAISSERSLVDKKEKNFNINMKTVLDLHKRKEERIKHQKIRSELEEKEKIIKNQACVLSLKGMRFFEHEKALSCQKKSEQLKSENQKSFIETKQKTEKMDDERSGWWKKFLQKKNVQKFGNLNYSQYNLKRPDKRKPDQLIREFKDKIIKSIPNDKLYKRSLKKIKKEFYINLHNFETQVNKELDKDISSKFLDNHLVRETHI